MGVYMYDALDPTLQLLGGLASGIPVLGAVAAGGLVETFDDVQERLDLAPVLDTRGLFALTVNGDSMVDAHIADGDVVLMEPVQDPSRLREGTIVSALVPGSGTTLKHFHRDGRQVRLEAANPAYAPIVLDWSPDRTSLDAEWRTLTVTEEGRKLAPWEAAGHRLRLGSLQLVVYRSLHATDEFRSVLGLYTDKESVIARFDERGYVLPDQTPRDPTRRLPLYRELDLRIERRWRTELADATGTPPPPAAADIGLANAGRYLADTFGRHMGAIWAIGLLAAGIDPAKATLFIQSQVPEHTELAWIFNTLTPLGELERQTQFKEKSSRQEQVMAGILNYPVLQAADILLYLADLVPVGEDQRQHLELTRDLAQRFNSRFGETFTVPRARIVRATAKVLDLQDPTAKMSKSVGNTVGILAQPEDVWQRVRTAVTDPQRVRKHDPGEKVGVVVDVDGRMMVMNLRFGLPNNLMYLYMGGDEAPALRHGRRHMVAGTWRE